MAEPGAGRTALPGTSAAAGAATAAEGWTGGAAAGWARRGWGGASAVPARGKCGGGRGCGAAPWALVVCHGCAALTLRQAVAAIERQRQRILELELQEKEEEAALREVQLQQLRLKRRQIEAELDGAGPAVDSVVTGHRHSPAGPAAAPQQRSPGPFPAAQNIAQASKQGTMVGGFAGGHQPDTAAEKALRWRAELEEQIQANAARKAEEAAREAAIEAQHEAKRLDRYGHAPHDGRGSAGAAGAPSGPSAISPQALRESLNASPDREREQITRAAKEGTLRLWRVDSAAGAAKAQRDAEYKEQLRQQMEMRAAERAAAKAREAELEAEDVRRVERELGRIAHDKAVPDPSDDGGFADVHGGGQGDDGLWRQSPDGTSTRVPPLVPAPS